MYHPGGYGGWHVADAVFLPDGTEAFVTNFLGDNEGPPNITQCAAAAPRHCDFCNLFIPFSPFSRPQLL